MVRKSLLIGIYFLICLTAYPQTIMWERVNSFASMNVNMNLVNGQYITLSGLIDNNDTSAYGNYTARLFKYDLAGNLIWQKTTRTVLAGPSAFVPMDNGNFLLAGQGRYMANGFLNEPNVFIQQVSPLGDTIAGSAVTFVTPDTVDWHYSLLKLNDNNYALSGHSADNGLPTMTLRKFDANGNTFWYKHFGKNLNAWSTSALINQANEFIILGRRSTINQTPYSYSLHPYMLKISQNGDSILGKEIIVFDSTLCEDLINIANVLCETENGDYVFGGLKYNCSNGLNKGYIARVDSAFNLLWNYELPQSTQVTVAASKIVELEDQSILILAGESPVQPTGFKLIRLDSAGDLISEITLQSEECASGLIRPFDWEFLPDSSIIICGECGIPNIGSAYVSRWSNLGLPTIVFDSLIVNGQLAAVQSTNVQIYPNPAKNQVQVQLPDESPFNLIHLYSITGQKLIEQKIKHGHNRLPLIGIRPGLYIYKLFGEDQTLTGKLVVD